MKENSRLKSGLFGLVFGMTSDWLDGFCNLVVPYCSGKLSLRIVYILPIFFDSASLLVVLLGLFRPRQKDCTWRFFANGEDMDIILWYVFIFFFSVSIICIHHFVVILDMKKHVRNNDSEIWILRNLSLRRHTPRIPKIMPISEKLVMNLTKGVMFLSRYRGWQLCRFDYLPIIVPSAGNSQRYQMILDWNISEKCTLQGINISPW